MAALHAKLLAQFGRPGEVSPNGLAWVAFSRLVIETSSASFEHHSMSFAHAQRHNVVDLLDLYRFILCGILESAKSPILGESKVLRVDARDIQPIGMKFGRVITSPPYANRMSYIRELRPYMYWTGFLNEASEAAALDWMAIGGTWGTASNRLAGWKSEETNLPQSVLDISDTLRRIDRKTGPLLGNYVHKYFHDMHQHLRSLSRVLEPGAKLTYIVGNSSFFGTFIETPVLLRESLKILGYSCVATEIIRRRNSNKGLFEYKVAAVYRP